MDFYQRVILVCRQIPEGKVASYGQIALLCGMPKNARQVGYGLNRRIREGEVPAHRVVNGQGYLSGAQAFAQPDLQKIMLEAEGVEVRDNRVDLKRFGWHNTMEDALRMRGSFEEMGI
ncbi:cysteine methyltransferase [Clostridium sp. MCC353]|uniref:MGMT family protein n=1 Tax=Clostridium sp. MCC353 TaxID=2592646 RepID=UPI001C031B7D|nr:MGMT family protein [Clostridium sp. MCC353]MBT9779745.1 cysteine methyltransferase [Clostridium sp. MCC353]